MAETVPLKATVSKRYTRLREANVKMLNSWKHELDAPKVLSSAFPTISSGAKPLAAALQSLYDQFWAQFEANVMVRQWHHNGMHIFRA